MISISEHHIKSWINAISHTPIRDDADRQIVLRWIDEAFTGYVACTDYPGAQFTPELMELHPDAIVICTVRDPEKWWKSIEALSKNVSMEWLRVILFPVPVMRYCARGEIVFL